MSDIGEDEVGMGVEADTEGVFVGACDEGGTILLCRTDCRDTLALLTADVILPPASVVLPIVD
jgi:hypothetical protein